MSCIHLALLLATCPTPQNAPRDAAPPRQRIVQNTLDVKIRATGRSGTIAQSGGRYAALAVNEAWQGNTDLNGDGDALDRVIHILDLATGTTTNLGLATLYYGLGASATQYRTFPSFLPVRGQRLGFIVSEAEQGGMDLNGDGDALDAIATVYDVSTGTLTSSGLSGAVFLGQRPWAMIAVQEPQHGDLDGNGLLTDDVVHLWNVETGAVTNLGLPFVGFGTSPNIANGWNIHVNGTSFLFNVPESVTGIDTNGDGDTQDDVLHVFDAALNQLFVTGLATTRAPLIRNGMEVLTVSESAQGSDLNGDGDTGDEVLYLYHKPTGQLRLLPFALGTFSQGSHAGVVYGDPFKVHGDRVVFTVLEWGQGQDLNGDGDTNDHIAFLHDFATNSTRMLHAVYKYALNDDYVAYEAYEFEEGIDWNGDGDKYDWVLQVHEIVSGDTHNTGVAASFFRAGSSRDDSIALEGDRVAWLADERDEGADLNGDGDESDRVLHVYDASTRTLTNVKVTAFGAPLRWDSDLLLFGVPRQTTNDHLLNVLDARNGQRIETPVHMKDLPPPYRRTLVVLSDERVEGVDLNHDGDLDDSVYRFGRILAR